MLHFQVLGPCNCLTLQNRLGDNYVLKCSFDSFAATNYASPCVENCQNYIAMHRWSPTQGEGHEMKKNCETNLSHSFPCFSNLIPEIGELGNIKVWL